MGHTARAEILDIYAFFFWPLFLSLTSRQPQDKLTCHLLVFSKATPRIRSVPTKNSYTSSLLSLLT